MVFRRYAAAQPLSQLHYKVKKAANDSCKTPAGIVIQWQARDYEIRIEPAGSVGSVV